MEKRTLKQAFNAVFHTKESFNDFINLNIEDEVSIINIKERKIIKQSERLKKYLRFVDKVILRSLAKDDDVVHSFIKERSTLTAVQAHAQNKYFFLTDIKDFYINIGKDDVIKILNRDKDSIPIRDIEKYIEFLSYITTYQGHIPVGFSTSPQLSNAFLFEFDRELKGFCHKNLMTYTRYADDIIVSGDSRREIEDLNNHIQEKIKQFTSPSLSLNTSKTIVTWKGNKIKILGLVILPNGKVTVDKKHKRLIETLLHFYTTDKEKYNAILSESMRNDEKSLFGLLHYINSVDPSYLSKLQRKYGALSLHTLMESNKNEN